MLTAELLVGEPSEVCERGAELGRPGLSKVIASSSGAHRTRLALETGQMDPPWESEELDQLL